MGIIISSRTIASVAVAFSMLATTAHATPFGLFMPDGMFTMLQDDHSIDPNDLDFEPAQNQLCGRDKTKYKMFVQTDSHADIQEHSRLYTRQDALYYLSTKMRASAILIDTAGKIVSVFSVKNGRIHAATTRELGGLMPANRRCTA